MFASLCEYLKYERTPQKKIDTCVDATGLHPSIWFHVQLSDAAGCPVWVSAGHTGSSGTWLIWRHQGCAVSSETLELSCSGVVGLWLPLQAHICLLQVLCHICQTSLSTSAVSQHLRWLMVLRVGNLNELMEFLSTASKQGHLPVLPSRFKPWAKDKIAYESKLRIVVNFARKKPTRSHHGRRKNGEQTLWGEVFFSMLSWWVQ